MKVVSVRLSAAEISKLQVGEVPATLLEKIERKQLSKGCSGLSPADAMAAFREVLGDRVLPPMGAMWGMLGNRVRLLGLTKLQCRSIALAAAEQWPKGRIKAMSLVNNAESLLAEAQLELPATRSTPTPDMEDL